MAGDEMTEPAKNSPGTGQKRLTLVAAISYGAVLAAGAAILPFVTRWLFAWPTYIWLEQFVDDLYFMFHINHLPEDVTFFHRADTFGTFILITTIVIGSAALGSLIAAGLWMLSKATPLSAKTMMLVVPFLVLIIVLSTCSYRPLTLIDYEEEGDWKTWRGDIISMRIPSSWSVEDYCLLDENGESVFGINWWEGGPAFIECGCAPLDQYSFKNESGRKIWSVTFVKEGRNIKMANERYRLDIHLDYGERDKATLNYIVESCRFVSE